MRESLLENIKNIKEESNRKYLKMDWTSNHSRLHYSDLWCVCIPGYGTPICSSDVPESPCSCCHSPELCRSSLWTDTLALYARLVSPSWTPVSFLLKMDPPRMCLHHGLVCICFSSYLISISCVCVLRECLVLSVRWSQGLQRGKGREGVCVCVFVYVVQCCPVCTNKV